VCEAWLARAEGGGHARHVASRQPSQHAAPQPASPRTFTTQAGQTQAASAATPAASVCAVCIHTPQAGRLHWV
jgi:hypothetical protein